MLEALFIVFMLALVIFAQLASMIHSNKKQAELRSRLVRCEMRLTGLAHALEKSDKRLKDAVMVANKVHAFSNPTELTGRLAMYSGGKTAVVRATFQTDGNGNKAPKNRR